MMKRNKLYTVTAFNKPMFMPKEHLFPNGGNVWQGLADNWQGYDDSLWDDKTTQYMNSKNFLGISKKNNPFSKGNLAQAKQGLANVGTGLAAAGIGMLGNAAGNAIAGGKTSKAGNMIGSVGSAALGMAGTAIGGPIGGAIGSALGSTLGGLANAAFGSELNEQKISEVESNNAQREAENNALYGVNSTDDLINSVSNMTNAMAFNQGDIGDDGWFSSDAEDKYDELKAQQEQIDRMRGIAIGTATGKVNRNQYINSMKNNLVANGGPLFMRSSGTLFDFGGDLQTHGGDFGTGLTHIDTGKSHEENPNDGVQMGVDQEGVPNLVEEGETVYDDYVFSNRILADETTKKLFRLPKKKDITFADISKRLEKEIAERPNDPISEAGFKAQMQSLEEQQERQKQEMEAERAKAAFEALSPEEQAAVMQQVAQQEAMAEQAAQEQAMAEQQAMQQPSPEEAAIMQQQADGSQAMIGQEPPMMAEGGHLFKDGGDKMTKAIYKMLGAHTDSDIETFAKKNGLNVDDFWKMLSKGYGTDGTNMELWKKHVFSNPDFIKAVNNPALIDAINKGYDFGLYKPSENGKATIKSISKGNWNATNGAGWLGSDDPAWLEATKDMSEDDIKKLSTEDVAKLIRATNSYKKGTEWLQNKDNALLYLNTLMNDAGTPQVAKDYADKFVKDGQWKDGFNYDYATVFGSNGKGVRETNPGTYWHTPVEAIRGAQAKNFVIGEDGKVEEIIGDVPTDWTSAGNYSWATPENDITYNYYKRPIATAEKPAPESTAQTQQEPEDSIKAEPILRAEWPRYMGLFGPAVGLGMMAAGVGKPDYGMLDAAVNNAGKAHLASYKPIGNYLRYNPMDIWYEQNRMDANARATDRAIMNNAAPIGTKMAGLLASGYNNQIANGQLYRNALEYNDAKRAQVAEFNRGTDKYNADAFTRNSQFNAAALNDAEGRNLNARLHAASERLNRDAGWYNSLYGNVAGLFRGLGDLGRENAQWNMIARGAADGVYGNLGDSYTGQKAVRYSAKGGKIKKGKRGKRGLTF